MDIIDRIFEFLLKGNTKAKIAIIASFAIFLKMLYDLFGLEYLSMTTDEMSEDLGMGIAIGEVLPFDIGTLLIGGIVIWLANYGLEHSKEGMKLAKIANSLAWRAFLAGITQSKKSTPLSTASMMLVGVPTPIK